MKTKSFIFQPVFQKYANLYDLFYAEKITQKNQNTCSKLSRSISARNPAPFSTSKAMLTHAIRKSREQRHNIRFIQGDVRTFDLKKKFDVVTAMFAVMSYQTSHKDILSAVRSVRKHLRKGGVFFFDAWFGHGVLTDPPRDRVKNFVRDGREILRTAKSTHIVDNQRVDVHYDILALEGKHIVDRVKETHAMHYFFPSEVEELATTTGFKLVECHPFLRSADSLSVTDWNATFVLKMT